MNSTGRPTWPTERPITVSEGKNHLAGTDPDAVVSAVEGALEAPHTAHRPALWDGATAPRIVEVLLSRMAERAGST